MLFQRVNHTILFIVYESWIHIQSSLGSFVEPNRPKVFFSVILQLSIFHIVERGEILYYPQDEGKLILSLLKLKWESFLLARYSVNVIFVYYEFMLNNFLQTEIGLKPTITVSVSSSSVQFSSDSFFICPHIAKLFTWRTYNPYQWEHMSECVFFVPMHVACCVFSDPKVTARMP